MALVADSTGDTGPVQSATCRDGKGDEGQYPLGGRTLGGGEGEGVGVGGDLLGALSCLVFPSQILSHIVLAPASGMCESKFMATEQTPATRLPTNLAALVTLRPGLVPSNTGDRVATYAYAGVTLRVYWDRTDADNQGWAWETTGMAATDSGSLDDLDDLDEVLSTAVDTSPADEGDSEDLATQDYETGLRIHAVGLPMTYCECSSQEFGWESAADEQQERGLECSIFVNI